MPHQWTVSTHFVLSVINKSRALGERQNVSGSISQNIGTQFAATIAAHVAVNEKGVVITSLPGSNPRANNAVVKPDVAELTEIQ